MLDQLRSYYSFLKPQSGLYQYMPFSNAPNNRSRTRIALITGACIIAALSVSALFVNPNPVHAPNFAGTTKTSTLMPSSTNPIFCARKQQENWRHLHGLGRLPVTPSNSAPDNRLRFIGGRHYGGASEHSGVNGTINNGVFMTKPNSTMARIVVREQHAGFQRRMGRKHAKHDQRR
ncbi:hypothetical protein J3E72DRAFT_416362 [Bipolaris maydis]|nr:hypothetical protein J3E72DRAFT_416362 [Bipolaris maydis]